MRDPGNAWAVEVQHWEKVIQAFLAGDDSALLLKMSFGVPAYVAERVADAIRERLPRQAKRLDASQVKVIRMQHSLAKRGRLKYDDQLLTVDQFVRLMADHHKVSEAVIKDVIYRRKTYADPEVQTD